MRIRSFSTLLPLFCIWQRHSRTISPWTEWLPYFTNNLSIIGEKIIEEVQLFFATRRMRQAHNHTFITLIPKSNNVCKVENVRQIALCNVFFKIITKILVGCIREIMGDIVHPSQAIFILNRSIMDNIITNYEVMHYLNNKKGKIRFMVIKIDLAKAYDQVDGSSWRCRICMGFRTSLLDLSKSASQLLSSWSY